MLRRVAVDFASSVMSLRALNSASRLGVSVALGVVLGLGGVRVVEPRWPTSPTLQGLQVGGVIHPVHQDLKAQLAARNQAYRDHAVTFIADGVAHRTTLGLIGAAIDIDATLRQARAVGHRGSLLKRWRETQAARRGEIDVPLSFSFDETAARAFLASLAPSLVVAPVDARLDLAQHRKVADVEGRTLDVAASLVTMREAVPSAPAVIALATSPVKAAITLDDLEHLDLSQVLGTYETRFKVWKKGRSHNVAHAAEKLNGLVLQPGQTFSFNERVGPRTLDAGFQRAPEIVGDELTIGVGGGTCQVSSTLYAAAQFGGMKIIERRSHSRPSGYTKLGLDATVAYPKVDLRIQNPFRFSVVIHAFVPKPGVLKVEILGGKAVERVAYSYGISNIEKYERRIVEKSWYADGRVYRKQKGTRGMDVHSIITLHYVGGRTERRQTYSGYRATPEVYWVAPGTGDDALPDLPEHASGVEGRSEPEEMASDEDIYATAG